MRWILVQSANAWSFIRDLMTVLRPCRFSVLIVVAGAALLFSPQGQEIAVRLPAESYTKSVWFDLCVFLWALQSWYWSRLVLDAMFEPDRHPHLNHPREQRIRWLMRHVPRAIGVASYLVAIGATVIAGAYFSTARLAVEACLFLGLLVYRRSLIERHTTIDSAAQAPGTARAEHTRSYAFFFARGDNAASLLRSLPPFARMFLCTTFVAALALTIWVCTDPVSFGWFFGAAAVPFLGFSMIVPVGSWLVIATRDGGMRRTQQSSPLPADTSRGYPVVTTLLAIALLFTLVPALDNHAVRTLATKPAPPGQALDEYLDGWHAQAPRRPDGQTHLVVVAAAGGGLRAAYWTATVLGAIQDGHPEFHRQLVGISAVSGGSLGAATFVALLEQAQRDQGKLPGVDSKALTDCHTRTWRPNTAAQSGVHECFAQAVLGRDFLGPTVAGLLFPDLIHRFLPLGFPDRAKALEQSWERAWQAAAMPDPEWAERGFREAWKAPQAHLPALFLNGTHVESGKRIITSHIDIAAAPGVFRDTYDFYRFAHPDKKPPQEIRFSTAAHNSARFSYVSPAGTLPDGTHLVDGGYFENFGAATAQELLRAGLEKFNGRNSETSKRIRPIVIVISNDPKLHEHEFPPETRTDPPAFPHPTKAKNFAGEVLSPLRALLKTRDARGLLAVSELNQVVVSQGGEYFHFLLCESAEGSDPALGWVLSGDGEKVMQTQIRGGDCEDGARKKNDVRLKRLLEVLKEAKVEAPSDSAAKPR